jgi:ABC-2 type transport system ATP-binding protein
MGKPRVPAVVMKGVTKTYSKGMGIPIIGGLLGKKQEKVRAVRGLDLEVRSGEVFGFLGPNGAGKSTVMGMVAGILTPSSGSIKVFGKDIAKYGPETRLRIGFMPEVPALYDEMGAVDIVGFHGGFYGLTLDEARERGRRILKRLGVKDQLDAKVGTLSHGNRKKVGLAIALVHRPDLLILDEPTSGLDPGSVKVFRKIVKELKGEGRTVFVSSHVLTEIERICDTVGIMAKGRLKLVEGTEDLLKRAGVEEGEKEVDLERIFLKITGGDEGGEEG